MTVEEFLIRHPENLDIMLFCLDRSGHYSFYKNGQEFLDFLRRQERAGIKLRQIYWNSFQFYNKNEDKKGCVVFMDSYDLDY